MPLDSDFNAVCSVTEMAKRLDLSRARFYQLLKLGVFPQPVYCLRTRRPLYTGIQQQRYEEIRKTGIADDGRLILFNRPRKGVSTKSPKQPDETYQEFTAILRKMGLNTTLRKVKNAIESRFPGKLSHLPDRDIVIRELFKYLEQRS